MRSELHKDKGMIGNRGEIKDVLKKQNIRILPSNDGDEDLTDVLNHLYEIQDFERPDGYIIRKGISYGIEHFRVSQYIRNKDGDIQKRQKVSLMIEVKL